MNALHRPRPFSSSSVQQRPRSVQHRLVAAGSMQRRSSVQVLAAKPTLMVNSCCGKMGRAVAEAAVRAGLPLVPYTLCGAAEAAANSSIEVAGTQMQLVGPDTRDQVIEKVSMGTAAAQCVAAIHSPHCQLRPQPSRQQLPVGVGASSLQAAALSTRLSCPSITCLSAGEAGAPQPRHG